MRKTIPRSLRRNHITPRMQQVLDIIAKAGSAGIKRTDIEAELRVATAYLRDLLQGLRFLGVVDTVGSKKYSRWVLTGETPRRPEDVFDLPNPRQIIRASGEWQAKIEKPQAWFPQ